MMRRNTLWTATVVLAGLCGSAADAEIQIVQSDGKPVPEGAATVNYRPATGGWEIILHELYEPYGNTVYNIRANAGETIDWILIDIEGPPAGSPVIVRVFGEAPGGLRTVRNIFQLNTAEIILNKVEVTQDIGHVEVETIGTLTAGRDVIGPIIATTPNNSLRGVTTIQAGRDILGDVTADHGRIGLVWAQRMIGSPTRPCDIRAKHNVMQVMAEEVYANINTRHNGGQGGFWALVANRFIGSLTTEQLLFNSHNQLDGRIHIYDEFNATITIGKSFNSPTQYIELPQQGLNGQIIINADGSSNGTWAAPIRIGHAGDPAQIVLTSPRYTYPPNQIGGGAVGLVPFALHGQACVPAHGQTVEVSSAGQPFVVSLRHYGPIEWSDSPVTIERRDADSEGPFTAVNSSQFSFSKPQHDPTTLQITAAPPHAGFEPGYEYRIRPTAQLVCSVASQTPVAWDYDYLFTLKQPSCPGDVDGSGQVDVNDLLIVLALWGNPPGALATADMNSDGIVNVEDLLTLIANWGPCPQPAPAGVKQRQAG